MKTAWWTIVFIAAVVPAIASPVDSGVMPEVIRWGMSARHLQRELEGMNDKTYVLRRIDPPFLPRIKDRQLQIDCEGIEFLGRRRQVEFVIGDDRLQMVWIMVHPSEQERIVQALIAAYGPPERRNRDYLAWTGARVAWRFKPTEVLFYSPELDADMAPDFAPEPAG